jgi:hypothetical protein
MTDPLHSCRRSHLLQSGALTPEAVNQHQPPAPVETMTRKILALSNSLDSTIRQLGPRGGVSGTKPAPHTSTPISTL